MMYRNTPKIKTVEIFFIFRRINLKKAFLFSISEEFNSIPPSRWLSPLLVEELVGNNPRTSLLILAEGLLGYAHCNSSLQGPRSRRTRPCMLLTVLTLLALFFIGGKIPGSVLLF